MKKWNYGYYIAYYLVLCLILAHTTGAVKPNGGLGGFTKDTDVHGFEGGHGDNTAFSSKNVVGSEIGGAVGSSSGNDVGGFGGVGSGNTGISSEDVVGQYGFDTENLSDLVFVDDLNANMLQHAIEGSREGIAVSDVDIIDIGKVRDVERRIQDAIDFGVDVIDDTVNIAGGW